MSINGHDGAYVAGRALGGEGETPSPQRGNDAPSAPREGGKVSINGHDGAFVAGRAVGGEGVSPSHAPQGAHG